jgi:pre-mRNA-splicing helicase BRR2
LLEVINSGIGYIYEGMPEVERQIVEELFKVEGISILVTTHTLKWDIDFKIFMVAVLDTTYYDPGSRRWADYSIGEMGQLMSLAGIQERDRQRGREFSSAKFVIYCQAAKKDFYKKFLFEPFPLESALQHNLHNHFNSAVVSKIITNKGEGVDWLTWTFMYRRLLSNPNYYNLDLPTEEAVSIYLSDLIDETAEYLGQIKCLEEEEGEENTLVPTNLGIICSYYYIKVETLAVFLQRVTDSMKLKDVVALLSQAEELSDCQYRPKEYQIIAQYLTQVSEKPLNKAHGLLLLHFYRIQIAPELLQETRALLPLCVRLAHALVDVLSSLGHLKPLIFCMQVSQMLVQAMWVN